MWLSLIFLHSFSVIEWPFFLVDISIMWPHIRPLSSLSLRLVFLLHLSSSLNISLTSDSIATYFCTSLPDGWEKFSHAYI